MKRMNRSRWLKLIAVITAVIWVGWLSWTAIDNAERIDDLYWQIREAQNEVDMLRHETSR